MGEPIVPARAPILGAAARSAPSEKTCAEGKENWNVEYEKKNAAEKIQSLPRSADWHRSLPWVFHHDKARLRSSLDVDFTHSLGDLLTRESTDS